MKRFYVIFLAVLLLLSGCGKKKTDPVSLVSNETADAFSVYLDQEHFVPEISQGSMIDQMEKYSYQGTSINELCPGFHYDGVGGGGYYARGTDFGYLNDYSQASSGKYADYLNRLYTKVPLEGLSIPLGITFQDDLSQVLEKLGYPMDPASDFFPDYPYDNLMTLYRSENTTIELKDYAGSKVTAFSYELKYTEDYSFLRYSGKTISTVTRHVILRFAPETYQLSYLELEVNEHYPINP